MAKLRMPDGVKLRGANIVPKAASVLWPTGTTPGPYAWLRNIIDWDWEGWIKPQIDCIAGNGVRGNVVRMIGANLGVAAGYFSQQSYDSKIEQIASYCDSLGIYFYACGGSRDQASGEIPSVGVAVDSYRTTLRMLSTHSSVIGFDVLQECNGAGSPNDAVLLEIVSSLRGYTDVPLTLSTYEKVTSSGSSWLNSVVNYLDFIDFHAYDAPVTPTHYEFYRNTKPGMDIVIGEYGIAASRTIDESVDFLRNIRALSEAADPMIRGGLIWGVSDQDNVNSNRFGLYTAEFSPRQARLNVLRELA